MSTQGASANRAIVAGAGPAGLALATALANAGLATQVSAPDPEGTWRASYGAWAKSLSGHELLQAVSGQYESPTLWHDKSGPYRLSQTYLRFDTAKLQRLLLSRARDAGVVFRAETLGQDAPQKHPDAVVVDATGKGLNCSSSKADSYQSAYGKWLHLKATSSQLEDMCLMDFRAPPQHPPSFLYGMNEETETYGSCLFVQETVLAHPRPFSFNILESRLKARLVAHGIEARQVLGEEYCVIAMGQDLPQKGSTTLRYGASGSMVHPATGYQFSHAINEATTTANAIVANLPQGRNAAIDAAIDALWPVEKRRAWQLYRWGGKVLAQMGQEEIRRFVAAFFQTDEVQWRCFMDGTLPAADTLSLMWKVFKKSPNSLRLRLVESSIRSGKGLVGSILVNR